MEMRSKGNGPIRRFLRVVESGRCASVSGPVPQRIEERTTNPLVVGWNPTRPTTIISPACSLNYLRGLTSGTRPKAEFTRLTAIVSLLPKESKAQADVSRPHYPLAGTV